MLCDFARRGPALLALCCFAGCGGCGRNPEAYPDDFTYPPREDCIVVSLPKEVPTQHEPAGELDEGIRRINDRGGRVLDPANVSEKHRAELHQFLRSVFGTPAQPTLIVDDELQALAATTGLTQANLAEGSRLFRKFCQECHGPTGNGRGMSAPWFKPHPRDFRQGSFKFVSTVPSSRRKPTRDDLFATITNGLSGTQMPSFLYRSEEERQRLIDYVIFLSIRGRVEFEMLRTLLIQGDDGLNGSVTSDALEILRLELTAWNGPSQALMRADEPAIVAEELPAAVRRGQLLFNDPKNGACATCHVDYGRQAKLQYDNFGTILQPANLTEPRRKGGAEASNFYRRIHGGIDPVNMPAVIGLSESQKWDVVRFLQALPYPDRLAPEVKDAIYPR